MASIIEASGRVCQASFLSSLSGNRNTAQITYYSTVTAVPIQLGYRRSSLSWLDSCGILLVVFIAHKADQHVRTLAPECNNARDGSLARAAFLASQPECKFFRSGL
jgi:hypothetical protein